MAPTRDCEKQCKISPRAAPRADSPWESWQSPLQTAVQDGYFNWASASAKALAAASSPTLKICRSVDVRSSCGLCGTFF